MEGQFSKKDFERMMYNPRNIPGKKKVLHHFPELGKLPAWRRNLNTLPKDSVLKYILCVYDKGSPFREKYNTDIVRRKLEAALEAGFVPDENGQFEEEVERMMRWENNKVNAMIIEYVRHHRSHKFAYLVAIEESFYRLVKEVAQGKTRNLGELEKIQDKLEETMLQIINLDDVKKAEEYILRYIEEERISDILRPEAVAKKIQSHETAVPDKRIL